MFNYLTNNYPSSIFIKEKEYAINSDFKTLLKIIEIIDDAIFSENEKILNSIYLFYKDENSIDLKLVYEAYEEIIKFIGCYKESEKVNKSNKKTIDYSIDSCFIYAAFIQLYNIDLSVTKLHWFKFVALLNNLNEGKPFLLELINCRAIDINDTMSIEMKKYYLNMKKEYGLSNSDETRSFANTLSDLIKKSNSD